MSIKTRKFADDGWEIWIDGDDRSTVYLNEWINPKDKSYVDNGGGLIHKLCAARL